MWWKLSTIISCGTLAGASSGVGESVHFHRVEARQRGGGLGEEGGASLDILSGFVAGNFSGYYLGLTMVALMAVGSG